MSAKDDALKEIVTLVKRHHLSLAEIKNALESIPVLGSGPDSKPSSSTLSKLLIYLGGIFVFAGIGVFISMFWDDFGSAARVIVTLGVGFAAFVMALVCLSDSKYENAATPFFIIAALLQPTGILVMLQEYASGGDTRYGLLFMAGVMLIQQAATFWAKRRAVLAFSSLFFGVMFFAVLFDIWGIDEKWVGIIIGTSVLCVTFAINQSKHAAIAPFWFFVGSLILLWSVFDLVQHSALELAYLGLCSLIIFLSTHVRSRTLLGVGTLAMLIYIGYFTAKHFANTLGWPIALVLIGVALIGLSSLAVRLNNKYIKSNS